MPDRNFCWKPGQPNLLLLLLSLKYIIYSCIHKFLNTQSVLKLTQFIYCFRLKMKITIFLTILWFGQVTLEETFKSSKRMKAKLEKNSNDICDMSISDVNKVRCFCNRDRYKVVTSAECLVLGTLPNEMYLWDLVQKSQPHLSEFKLVISDLKQMRSIPPKFFNGMLSMKTFSFTFSLMDHIPRDMFGNSSSLEEIDLSHNKIEDMKTWAISNLAQLHNLHLNHNKVTVIRKAVFYNLPKLKHLYLNSNSISKIEDKAFSGIATLLELDLSENDICDINKLTFFGLLQLKIIDLSHNKLTAVSSSVFSEMWDVEVSTILWLRRLCLFTHYFKFMLLQCRTMCSCVGEYIGTLNRELERIHMNFLYSRRGVENSTKKRYYFKLEYFNLKA